MGLAGKDRLAMVLDALARRFGECSSEKNASLVRTDVITSLGHLFHAVADPSIEACAEALMAGEKDEQARKKQRTCWRAATA